MMMLAQGNAGAGDAGLMKLGDWLQYGTMGVAFIGLLLTFYLISTLLKSKDDKQLDQKMDMVRGFRWTCIIALAFSLVIEVVKLFTGKEPPPAVAEVKAKVLLSPINDDNAAIYGKPMAFQKEGNNKIADIPLPFDGHEVLLKPNHLIVVNLADTKKLFDKLNDDLTVYKNSHAKPAVDEAVSAFAK